MYTKNPHYQNRSSYEVELDNLNLCVVLERLKKLHEFNNQSESLATDIRNWFGIGSKLRVVSTIINYLYDFLMFLI